MEDPFLFDPSNHDHKRFLPQLVEIHMACIEQDKTLATFLPPLDHGEITRFYEDQVREVEYGARDIIMRVISNDQHSGDKTEVAGFVMLLRRVGPDGKRNTQTGPFRADVLKLLVSPKHRRKGIARRLMTKLEEVAIRTGAPLLVSEYQGRHHPRLSTSYGVLLLTK